MKLRTRVTSVILIILIGFIICGGITGADFWNPKNPDLAFILIMIGLQFIGWVGLLCYQVWAWRLLIGLQTAFVFWNIFDREGLLPSTLAAVQKNHTGSIAPAVIALALLGLIPTCMLLTDGPSNWAGQKLYTAYEAPDLDDVKRPD